MVQPVFLQDITIMGSTNYAALLSDAYIQLHSRNHKQRNNKGEESSQKQHRVTGVEGIIDDMPQAACSVARDDSTGVS